MATWKPVDGWVGLYEVSDEGQVRSLDRTVIGTRSTRRVKGRVLRPGSNPKGYRIVVLARDGERVACTVHGLVAAAFIGPRPEGFHVCHGDGDPTNNQVGNLRYGTATENNVDTVRMGRNRNSAKTHCPQGHPYDEANTMRWGSQRKCRTCHRARSVAARARAKANLAAAKSATTARLARMPA